ncbi:MAG: rRNA maturation RNase YbeY [Candidatus Omnitrophica bacterium]|nr:rRNA maturation RNase YbeY [Candidatus Omnitrophota bacterium]
MRVKITNQQKIKRINLKQLHKYLEKVLHLLFVKGKNTPFQKISVFFCDNSFIKKLNKRYFKKFYATDVISFPLKDDLEADYLGEVVVSVEEAVKVAKELGCRWQDEVKLYLVHGILHLAGYDDCTKAKRKCMEKEQERILKTMDTILL